MMDDHEVHDHATLLELVKSGNVGKLRPILTNDPSILDSCRDWAGDSLLAIACWHSRVEVALMLIDEFQANVNDKNNVGRTPLHSAADHGDKDMLRLLCDRGADMDICDLSGKRPIDVGDEGTRTYLEGRMEVHHELALLKLRDFEEADKRWEESLLLKQDSIHISSITTLVNKAVPLHISGCQNESLNGVYTPLENHCHCMCPVYINRANPHLVLIYQSTAQADIYTFPSLNGKLSLESYWGDLPGEWVIQDVASIFGETTAFSRFSALDSMRLDVSRNKLSSFNPTLNLDLSHIRMPCGTATFPELRIEGSNFISEFEYFGGKKFVSCGKKCEVVVQTEELVNAMKDIERLKKELSGKKLDGI